MFIDASCADWRALAMTGTLTPDTDLPVIGPNMYWSKFVSVLFSTAIASMANELLAPV